MQDRRRRHREFIKLRSGGQHTAQICPVAAHAVNEHVEQGHDRFSALESSSGEGSRHNRQRCMSQRVRALGIPQAHHLHIVFRNVSRQPLCAASRLHQPWWSPHAHQAVHAGPRHRVLRQCRSRSVARALRLAQLLHRVLLVVGHGCARQRSQRPAVLISRPRRVAGHRSQSAAAAPPFCVGLPCLPRRSTE